MITNEKTAQNFAQNVEPYKHSANMFYERTTTDGSRVLYSYGTHFAIVALCNETKNAYLNATARHYSRSTARHFRIAVENLPTGYFPIYVDRPRDFLSAFGMNNGGGQAAETTLNTFIRFGAQFMNCVGRAERARKAETLEAALRDAYGAAANASSLAYAFNRFLNAYVPKEKHADARGFITAELQRRAALKGERYAAANAFFGMCSNLINGATSLGDEYSKLRGILSASADRLAALQE